VDPTFLLRGLRLNVADAGATPGHIHLIGGIHGHDRRPPGTHVASPSMVSTSVRLRVLAWGQRRATIPSMNRVRTGVAVLPGMLWGLIPA